MDQKGRSHRLVVDVSVEDSRAIEDFWFHERLPTKAAAIRELLRRGLAKAREENQAEKRRTLGREKIGTGCP